MLAGLLALAGCDSEPVRVTTMSPYVRLAAVPGRPAAGYFEYDIDNDPGALVAVTSPQAGRIEMHETMTAGNTASMHPIRQIAVRNGDRLVFSPGGRHLMIYDIAPGLGPGDDFALVLHFQRGPPLTLRPSVRAAGED